MAFELTDEEAAARLAAEMDQVVAVPSKPAELAQALRDEIGVVLAYAAPPRPGLPGLQRLEPRYREQRALCRLGVLVRYGQKTWEKDPGLQRPCDWLQRFLDDIGVRSKYPGPYDPCPDDFVGDDALVIQVLYPEHLEALRRIRDLLPDGPGERTGQVPSNPPPGAHLKDPASRAMAVAVTLKKAGKLTWRNLQSRANVGRTNLLKNHPDTYKAIQALMGPDRQLRRGIQDRRTGRIDAMDSD